MNFIVIIPSRYQSTRLPGKPLINLAGKSMIQRVWEKARQSGAADVIIATDDLRIEQACHLFKAQICLTRSSHQSGTDRLAEVVQKMNIAAETIIVNVQGDEPLIPAENISQLAQLLHSDISAVMATLSTPIKTKAELNDPNVVKVISDELKNALYFSRSVIPHDRDGNIQSNTEIMSHYQRHIGIYAYRAGFLQTFSHWDSAALEQIEKLEQLRVLSKGYKIKIAQALISPPAGIDTVSDVARVEGLLNQHEKD